MELGRLTLHEESDKHKKGITLKASTSQDQEDRDDDESDSKIDTETMTLLVRKFNKFFKKKGSSNRFHRKETRNPTFKNKNSKEKFLCHECGKVGQMKFQCHVYLKKVEGEKNTSRDFKSKKAYILWDVPEDDSTTSTYGEEETAKICLMVNDHEANTSSKVDELGEVNSCETSSCFSSNNSPTYDELYSAFVELHEKFKKIVKQPPSLFACHLPSTQVQD
ncbi:hypothetical protein Lal_00027067 [Lupinus albus]|nr:hypothetical protein Lal_00027067 [Lupinus albus]